MTHKIWKLITVFVFFSFILSGCCYFSARDQIKSAEMTLDQLKGQGGEKLAPYEYCSAEKYLEASRMEFSENDFKAAKGFADRSKSAAEAGLAEVKKIKK
jgi:hypothetical protein